MIEIQKKLETVSNVLPYQNCWVRSRKERERGGGIERERERDRMCLYMPYSG